MFRTLIAIVLFGVLTGCAVQPSPLMVHTSVTTFHRLPADLAGRTFAITPTDEQHDSLEFATYRDQLRQQLAARGLTEAAPGEADYLVAFDYYIDNGSIRTVSIPIWGQTGVSSATTTGAASVYGNTGTYNQTTTYTPSYGVTGFVPQSMTVFTRRLNVVIIKGRAAQGDESRRVYESNAVSVGSSNHLSMIAPKMISAVFKEFPGSNGSTRQDEVPCPECAQ